MRSSWKILICVGLLSGCVPQPTRVKENPEPRLESFQAREVKPLRITAETIVVDARPAFDYSTAHIPRSIPLRWADFTEPEPTQRGVLQADLFAAARRLARLGLSQTTPVVVIGNGGDGEGEEGRVAWMLRYFGIKDVQYTDLDALKANLTNAVEQNPPKSVPMWKPDPVESLNVTRAELKDVINRRGVSDPIVPLNGGEPTEYRIIDVRSEKAYLGKEGIGAQRRIPNMDAVNIPWREFFTDEMRPDPAIARRLHQIGIYPRHRIIVIDEDGVASAAVTIALRDLGYENAGNYAGGLIDLMSSYPNQ